MLLIDDDVELVGMFAEYLEQEGFRHVPGTAPRDLGRRAGRPDQIDLAELMDEIVADARFENGSGLPGDASPSVSVEAPGPVIVQGDPDLLWSALENIVRNAIRHGGSGGKVRAVLRSDGQSARIEVLDRGPGIAPADLASVFDPFVRSNPGANVDGHGLGLAIAQRVVLAHGGQIRAANREGGGLQVTVSLPLVP